MHMINARTFLSHPDRAYHWHLQLPLTVEPQKGRFCLFMLKAEATSPHRPLASINGVSRNRGLVTTERAPTEPYWNAQAGTRGQTGRVEMTVWVEGLGSRPQRPEVRGLPGPSGRTLPAISPLGMS